MLGVYRGEAAFRSKRKSNPKEESSDKTLFLFKKDRGVVRTGRWENISTWMMQQWLGGDSKKTRFNNRYSGEEFLDCHDPARSVWIRHIEEEDLKGLDNRETNKTRKPWRLQRKTAWLSFPINYGKTCSKRNL